MQACPERSVCDAAYTVYAEGHLVTAIELAAPIPFRGQQMLFDVPDHLLMDVSPWEPER